MKLYFKDVQGKERLIAECETVSDLHKEINKFLYKCEYVSHYMRSWGDENEIVVDVGSHSEFFVIKGISHLEYIKELQENNEPDEEYHQITWDEYLESLQKNRE